MFTGRWSTILPRLRSGKIVIAVDGFGFTEANFRERITYDGATLKRHRNGGGWVPAMQDEHDQDAAFVEDRVYVGPQAMVTGAARVTDEVIIEDCGMVGGSARVSGRVCVAGTGLVSGNARVSDNVYIGGDAIVTGTAVASGDAKFLGYYDTAEGEYSTGLHGGVTCRLGCVDVAKPF